MIRKILYTLFFSIVSLQMIANNYIGRSNEKLVSDLMTPEVLWSMGRIGEVKISNDNKFGVYTVTYFSKKENKSHSVIYLVDLATKVSKCLTTSSNSEYSPSFIKNGKSISYLSAESGTMQLWTMNLNGQARKQISYEKDDISDYLFSPNEKKVILIKRVPFTHSIAENDSDLDKASGMVINDLMYKHWDHYVKSIPHPFLAMFQDEKIVNAKDILEGEPYESPMEPFGGIEQFSWDPTSCFIAYTCRKKVGLQYAISTDSDIFLYDTRNGKTKNICKSISFLQLEVSPTISLENQRINQLQKDENLGYDIDPKFSPNGKYIAWSSMERDGYESDRARLCVYNIATGEKKYVTEKFQSSVNTFLWGEDSKTLFFTGVWHGTAQIYRTNFLGEVKQVTTGLYDYSLVDIFKNKIIYAKRHSMSSADELFAINLKNGNNTQITFENQQIYNQIKMGKVEERWISTVDNKKMQVWVIYPPYFDPNKKYPTLLYCEGGPQSPISQFWSYRWNFQMMAANGYIIVAPNRRGLPGYGMDWLEEISGDYTGKCMQDYLSAIDTLSKEVYVDKNRLGAVGASFGGFSVYWLAGHHNKRFKAFIAHDGIYNTQQQYVETEELWFPNWDLGSAPWIKENGEIKKAYAQSPHLYVDKWDTPILCIHGQKDFRIEYTQAESAFAAAKLRGIPAQLLLFPDENHWVLKPQNGILWQRTFFRWLDKWLKK